MKLDAGLIRDALVPAAVLDHFEIEYREMGNELYTRSCPACGERSRESMGVHAAAGVWQCFARDVRVLTYEGTFPIGSLAGKRVRLLVPSETLVRLTGRDFSGYWKECEIKSFGRRRIWELSITRNGVSKKIKTTAGHRWFKQWASGKPHHTVVTTDLRAGDRLACLMPQTLRRRGTEVCPHGVAHGFVFGDGNINGKSSEVVLFGEKDAPLAPFFYGRQTGERVLESGIIGRRIGGLPRFFKSLPDLDEAPPYIVGFLAGLFAADGSVPSDGFPSLYCASKTTLEEIQTLCRHVGIGTYEISAYKRLGKSKTKTSIYRLPILRSTLTADFFLIEEHKRRFEANGSTFERMSWIVQNCRQLTSTEEVFCAIVPEQEAFVLEGDILTGNCQRCSAHGDILALIAAYAQIDIKTQFRRVLEIAASIAGIGDDVSPADRALIAERRQQAVERVQVQKRRSAALRDRMPATWESLATRDVRGESYLRDRGLDPAALRAIVRYTREGDPALPLRDLVTGTIVGIQHRSLQPDKPKLLCFRGSQIAGSFLYGQLTDLDPESVDVAVVVEGLADTLAAYLAFSGCAIFGSPGAAQIPAIVTAVAQRIAQCQGWLLLTVDDDKVGVKGAVQAVLAAEEAGLRLAPANAGLVGASTVRLVRLGKSLDGKHHHDLADAWARSRWRWTWPTT